MWPWATVTWNPGHSLAGWQGLFPKFPLTYPEPEQDFRPVLKAMESGFDLPHPVLWGEHQSCNGWTPKVVFPSWEDTRVPRAAEVGGTDQNGGEDGMPLSCAVTLPHSCVH